MSSIEEMIYGKHPIKNLVNCEVNGDTIELFIEEDDGVKVITKPFTYWLLTSLPYDKTFNKLEGNQFYKYIHQTDDPVEHLRVYKKLKKSEKPLYKAFDLKEMAMLYYGFGYFYQMKVSDVSVLSFDIETTGVTHDDNSLVLLISNTYKKKDKIIKKLFSFDEYSNQREMIDAWCNWVRELDPSILVGHNVFMFDIPYLNYVANQNGTTLDLGRDDSSIKINPSESKFRKDGSQFYSYHNATVYGREIVDTFFLSIRYDVKRDFSDYKLKTIVKEAGLEKTNRQFYDASNIRNVYNDPTEFNKVKQYAIDDADDSLAVYEKMIDASFYFNQYIPKPLQKLINGATGAQINSLMIRSYIQESHSIPKPSEVKKFQGAFSGGIPGIYRNVLKVDVRSLYPSIMLTHDIYDPKKDPDRHFIRILEYLTNERIKNKELGQQTGNKYYIGLSESQKVGINSFYGFLSTSGVHFNSPDLAAMVTRKGREVLIQSVEWATGMKEDEFNKLHESLV